MKERIIEIIFAIVLELIDCEEYDNLEWDVKINIELTIFEKIEDYINKLF